MAQLQNQFRLRLEQEPRSVTLEKMFDCCKLVNVELDMHDMLSLIQKIEEAQNSSLIAWKSAFTTSFLKKMKAAVTTLPFPQENRTPLLALSNFHVFTTFYDQNANNSKFESFYTWVSNQELKIVADADELEAVKQRIISEKFWSAKCEFAQGALKMLTEGVKLKDMIGYLRSMVITDPNPSIRRLAVEDIADGAE